jgi:hypothetical protein
MASEIRSLATRLFFSGVAAGAVLRLSLDGLRKLVSSPTLEGSEENFMMELAVSTASHRPLRTQKSDV